MQVQDKWRLYPPAGRSNNLYFLFLSTTANGKWFILSHTMLCIQFNLLNLVTQLSNISHTGLLLLKYKY